MVVGFIVGVLLVVVGAKVVVEVDLGFVVVVVVVPVVSDVVFVFLLSFLVFCVFAVNFSDLRFHHFLFYCHSNKMNLKLKIIYTHLKLDDDHEN